MEWGCLGLWIILAGVFLAGEIFTAGFFLFWFGVAAGVTAIVSLFGVAPTWQLVTFIALSSGLLMISRPFAEKVSGKQRPGIGANRFRGELVPTDSVARSVSQIRLQCRPLDPVGRADFLGPQFS